MRSPKRNTKAGYDCFLKAGDALILILTQKIQCSECVNARVSDMGLQQISTKGPFGPRGLLKCVY